VVFGVAASGGPSHRKMINIILNIHNVYILDYFLNVFVYVCTYSTRLVRAASETFSQELFIMIDQPEYALVTRLQKVRKTQKQECSNKN
jgi:hypothetical protein